MADIKIVEREYIIPLRRAWLRAAYYKRTRRAIMTIKKFVAKHMRVEDRDIDKVKLDMYLNNDLWFKGSRHPPAKVKVKVRKEGEIVKVTFAEIPEHVKFLKAKDEKFHKKDSKPTTKEEEKKAEGKTDEEKKNEVEKEKSVEQLNIKQAEQAAKVQKHTSKGKEPQIRRMALKK